MGPSRESVYTALFVGNQVLAVVTTILFIRYGKDAFSLTWCLGVVLTLGWGMTGFSLLDPSLAARVWSERSADGLKSSLRQLVGGVAVLALIGVVPWSAQKVTEWSGISVGWAVVFVALGLVRSFAQTMNVYSLRLGRHAEALGVQIAGRGIEIALVLAACALQEAAWLVAAWLVYPAAQLLVSATEWRRYGKLPLVANEDRDTGGAAWLVSVVARFFEMILATIWLRVAGDVVFVAYRAATAALANSTLLPRYWYAIVSADAAPRNRFTLPAIVVMVSLVIASVYQIVTDAVPHELLLWSMIPLVVNSALMPSFSRWRQQCLLRGQVVLPAMAAIAGCVGEVALLALMKYALSSPLEALILAHAGLSIGIALFRTAVRARASGKVGEQRAA